MARQPNHNHSKGLEVGQTVMVRIYPSVLAKVDIHKKAKSRSALIREIIQGWLEQQRA